MLALIHNARTFCTLSSNTYHSHPLSSGYDYRQYLGVPLYLQHQSLESTHDCMCTQLRSTASASSVDADVLALSGNSDRSKDDAPLAQADARAVVPYDVYVAAYMHARNSCSVCLWGIHMHD